MIGHFPDSKQAVFRGTDLSGDLLVTQVGVEMERHQLLQDRLHQAVPRRIGRSLRDIPVQIVRLEGREDQDLPHRLAHRREIGQARGKVLKQFVVRPVRFLVIERWRIVVFAYALQAVVRKMGTEKVQAVVGVPGGEPHPVFEGEIMARRAENLDDAPLQAILVGDRRHHLGIVQFLEAQAQGIDARHLHVPELRHHIALVEHIGDGLFLAIVMAGPEQANLGAIVAQRLAESLFHARAHRPVIMQAEGPPIPYRIDQGLKVRPQLIAVLFLEGRFHPGRIRDEGVGFLHIAPGRDLRLVGEDAHHPLAPGKALCIRLVGAVDEGLDGVRIHQVHPAGAVVPGLAHGVDVGYVKMRSVIEQDTVFGADRSPLGHPHKRPGAEGVVLPGHDASGESAGPLVFVVEPGLQAQLLRRLHARLHHVEPFLRKIGRQQARPTVKKGASEAAVLEEGQLPAHLIRRKAVVERPERHRAVGGRGMAEFVEVEAIGSLFASQGQQHRQDCQGMKDLSHAQI